MTGRTVRLVLVTLLAGCAVGQTPNGGATPEPDDPVDAMPIPPRPPRTGGTSGTSGTPAPGGTSGTTSPAPDASTEPTTGPRTDAGGADAAAADAGSTGDAAGGGDTSPASDAAPGPAVAACPGGKHLVCEDFEAATVGALPAGWTKDGAVSSVSNDSPHLGKQSLKVTDATFWHRRISRAFTIPGTHWGRVFYKVAVPHPRPASGVVHSAFVTLKGISPLGGEAEYRVVDTVLGGGGTHQFLYNVQTTGRGEFGKGSPYNWRYDGKWHCAEWRVDHATQTYQFFIDGSEVTQIAVKNGAGNYRGSEIPKTFTSVRVGWSNFQRISPGFGAWYDDVAIGETRIGCN